MSRQQYLRDREPEQEHLDQTPMEIPLWAKKPETMEQKMKRFFTSQQLQKEFDDAGVETIEEANDFELDDAEDMDWVSPFEFIDMDDEYQQMGAPDLSERDDEEPQNVKVETDPIQTDSDDPEPTSTAT